MTDPNIPLRLELSVEVPGTPEQVWSAIATGDGNTAWMMPTEMEEREGGSVVFHMGPDASSKGRITSYEPHRRVVYEEDWASLAGQDPSTVTPLVTEFLVEASSGGTCVVRVVSSAFGSGADWEREFFEGMEQGWAPMFEHLRLYLSEFPGQKATTFEAGAEIPGPPAAAITAVRAALDQPQVGQVIDLRGSIGRVEVVADASILMRLTEPVEGMLSIHAFRTGEQTAMARIAGYLFSAEAAAYVEREQPGWQSWLEGLVAEAPAG